MSNQENLSSLATGKIVTIHTLVVLGVVLGFGAINIFSGAVLFGIIIIVAGALVCGCVQLLRNKKSSTFRGMLLSQAQLLIIIVASVAKHELGQMFALMVASMAIAGIYYSKKNLITHWAVMGAATLLGLFFKEFIYGETGMDTIIKGIAGMHIGAFLIVYLVDCSVKFISDANKAKADADGLLAQVQEQMAETEAMSEQQRKVVAQIAEISSAVNSSAERMLDIAHDINDAADSQQSSIELVSKDISDITEQTQNALEEAEKAAQAASRSTELLNANNAEMQNMLTAYAEIEDSSAQIRNIVATIEDIAFQTNILALNASIEAARAGTAGRGFAVVADEVRNLANKSQQAVSNTAALIDTSLDAVRRGKEIADTVAERMTAVISTAQESESHARDITVMTEKQNAATAAVKERIEQISSVIAQTTQTSEQSTDIAGEVSENARRMDEVVKSFR